MEEALEPMASQRKTLSQALAPAEPQDFEWEPARSDVTAHDPDLANMDVGSIIPFERKGG